MKKLIFSLVLILSGTFLFASNGVVLSEKAVSLIPQEKTETISDEQYSLDDTVYLCCVEGPETGTQYCAGSSQSPLDACGKAAKLAFVSEG